VVLCNGTRAQAAALRQELHEFLPAERKLTLSMENTNVTHLHEGFQFLGFWRQRKMLIGSVGMERYGLGALPRSLAVAPAYRGQGLGRTLVERLLQATREQGMKRIFLRTESAPEFFPKFGFRHIPREETDVALRQSVEFRTACCESAVCMRLHL
jgi:amino-acid N-acetyltransferase